MAEMFIQEDGMDNKSFILRCKNEERWIGHSIQSIIDYLPESEIIIVNNNSSDDSVEIIKMFGTWNDVKIINIDEYSPGKSLNKGVQAASNEDLVVLSSHCEVNKFDSSVFDKLENYVAVFGNQIPIYKGKRLKKRYIWSHFIDNEVENMYSSIEDRYFLHNGFCIYRKSFLLQNPFDESLFGKEDRYWAIDMVNSGHKYLYDPSIVCDHHWTPRGATWKGIG